jgi:hypothetical protein
MPKLYARLYPYNPRNGFVVKSFTYKGTHYRGGVRPSWYECTESTKGELSQKTQEPGNPYAKPLFQFCDEENLKNIEANELNQIVAAKVLAEQALVDPTTIPKSRIIPLKENTGGRAAAIPPSRDYSPDVTSTAFIEKKEPVMPVEEDEEGPAKSLSKEEVEGLSASSPPPAKPKKRRSRAKKGKAPGMETAPVPKLPPLPDPPEGGFITTKDFPSPPPKPKK